MGFTFRRLASLAILFSLIYLSYAKDTKSSLKPIESLTTKEIEEQLQSCPLLRDLTAHRASTASSTPSLLQRSFTLLFPFSSPALNSLLGTLYISGPPNFLLALCPTDIDPGSLHIMVAFAVGGLLGDTLFHLLPEIFLGEVAEGEVRVVVVEGNRNLLLGVGMMVGFVTFIAMDKGLRIAMGGQGHEHSHGHKHESANGNITTGSSTNLSPPNQGSAKKRKNSPKPKQSPQSSQQEKKQWNPSTLLPILADFTHNITDGLALSSSFYASPTLGATTTLAVFCHEIPHEVGDFALLIQGGMSKKLAMGLQFVTALGAVLGTVIGIIVQEYGGSHTPSSGAEAAAGEVGLWGTSLQWGDMLLPFTAGTFLYVGTVGVIPELLETGKDKVKELKNTGLQFLAMAAGAGIMLGISWS